MLSCCGWLRESRLELEPPLPLRVEQLRGELMQVPTQAPWAVSAPVRGLLGQEMAPRVEEVSLLSASAPAWMPSGQDTPEGLRRPRLRRFMGNKRVLDEHLKQ